MKTIRFITAIDTDAGKSIITGLMARSLLKRGKTVITQKIAQTGCEGISEDIITHRKIMGIELMEEDHQSITCPYVFPCPSSPHLAARLSGGVIDPARVTRMTEQLAAKFEYVLIEGVGGLCVPLTPEFTLLDYLEKQRYPLILVATSKLGSLNHTLLSLETAWRRNLEIVGLVYNHCPNPEEPILSDSKEILKKYLIKYFTNAAFVEVPVFKKNFPDIDFSALF